jgi:hypothetical protein
MHFVVYVPAGKRQIAFCARWEKAHRLLQSTECYWISELLISEFRESLEYCRIAYHHPNRCIALHVYGSSNQPDIYQYMAGMM